MREFIKTHPIAIVVLILVIPTFAVFWQTLGHDFIVYYDDGEYVTENPHIQPGLTMKTAEWSLTAVRSANWHPLTWMSHALDCGLYGLNPEGHHLTNLALHVANVFLLFLALSFMTGCYWRSAFVAAFFAVHPLHVESVAWVAERKDVLSTFFWLLTMIAYWNYSRKPGIGRYLPVIIAFILGLMSKPMLVTLPLVLLLLDYWPLKRKERWSALVVEKIPLLILSAASSIVTFYAQSRGGAVWTLGEFSPRIRIENALASYVTYIWKMLWPRNLAVLYPHPADTLAIWKPIVSAILLIAISVLIFSLGRKRPHLTVGWLWFLGTLVPVIGLVQVGGQAVADRYTYVPLIGLFLIIVWAVSESVNGKTAILAPVLGIAVLLALTTATHAQLRYWQTSITLFERALKCTSDNYVVEDCLGLALAREGRFDEAMAHYKAALKIAPEYPPAHNNLGVILAHRGLLDEGIRECRESIRLNPRFGLAHYNLARALSTKKEYAEAVAEYRTALSVQPDDAISHNNLGNIYATLGSPKQAEDEFRAALQIDPYLTEAHTSLSSVLQGLGRLDEAARESRTAIRLDPSDEDAYYNLGVILQEQDKRDEAIKAYKLAVRLRIEYPPAYNNLAVVYYEKGDYAQAWKEVELCRKFGGSPHPQFIRLLSEKMPPPGR